MIEKLTIQGFKSLKNVSLDLGLITVIIGPNRSGKSSVLHALAALRQSLGQGHLYANGQMINLGSYQNILSTQSKEIKFVLTGKRFIDPAELAPISRSDNKIEYVTYKYGVMFGSDAAWVWHSGEISCNGLRFKATLDSYGNQELEPRRIQVDEIGAVDLAEAPYIAKPIVSTMTFSSNTPTTSIMLRRVKDAYDKIFNVIFNDLDSFRFVPVLRGFDNHSYKLTGYNSDVIANPNVTIQAQYASNLLTYRRDKLEDKVSDWTEKITGARIYVKIEPPDLAALRSRDGEVETYLVNDGFGLNQIVLMLLALAVAPEMSIIGIEEPEIHLHPSSQATLADILTDVAKKEKKQLIITTHSEHILLRLLTAVARRDLSPEELKVYYFERVGGETKVTNLAVNEKGQLEGGLKGFFEAELENWEKYLMALRPPTES